MGGTNAHVVLEQGPDPVAAAFDSPDLTTLVVSGKTAPRIAATAATLAEWIEAGGAEVSIHDVGYTLNHRSRFANIATVCARTHAEAAAGLRALASGQPAPGWWPPRCLARRRHGLPVFRPRFAVARDGSRTAGRGTGVRQGGRRTRAGLHGEGRVLAAWCARVGRDRGRNRPDPAGPGGYAIGAHAAGRSHGMEPDAVIGHSMGEVTAAVVAGALTPPRASTSSPPGHG